MSAPIDKYIADGYPHVQAYKLCLLDDIRQKASKLDAAFSTNEDIKQVLIDIIDYLRVEA